MGGIDLLRTLKFLPGIILGLTVHEFCHAYVAYKCGDSTAREQGRISMNPLKHIDPLGFILLLVAGFGWAKPVEFNEKNLKHPRIDILKIAVAGPLANALTAMLLSVTFVIWMRSGTFSYTGTKTFLYEILQYGIFINWGLFIFNMIPIPPLDGSHLLLSLFRKYPEVHNTLYRYGSFLLFAIIIASAFSKYNFLPIGTLINYFADGFMSMLGYRI
ncbi:MAG: site-2 protease family protein [Bacteroidales bacterium]|jgi:Zn-dependent protease